MSNSEKEGEARLAGAGEVVLNDQVPELVGNLPEGRGVAAVFDGIGGPTFERSLGSLRPRGILASYGAAGGPVPPIELTTLAMSGSVFLIRPRLHDFIATRDELLARAEVLFAWLRAGELSIRIGGEYALEDVGTAHRGLESRATVGELVLRVA